MNTENENISNDLDEICNEIYEMQKRTKTVSGSE